jgi:tagaturonate reductase
MMQLSKQYLNSVHTYPGVEETFLLPEKVLQFGTGVLLRGLCDYFIDKANKQNIFNGRIVVVKSTDSGGADAFEQQDGLYTHLIRGIENGQAVDEAVINASISRVLSAKTQWQQVLDCAASPHLQIIISNTTEVGITYTEEDIQAGVPASYPAKLLAFLYQRYQAFNGSAQSGMIIIPTELIVDNAGKLKNILVALAGFNKLDDAFVQWLITHNHFCNSLVDRIVPGKLPAADKAAAEHLVGYADELMIMSEVYSLWAIETAEPAVLQALSFSLADKGVVLAHDITKFRELKLRLLNGAHTFTCGLAVLAGFETVKEAMANETFLQCIQNLMLDEIAPGLVNDTLPYEEARNFALTVIDRFRNPYIDHKWLNITLQYSSKMLMRNVPNILNHYTHNQTPPKYMALGFAAYLRFMQSTANEQGQYTGQANGKDYLINDDKAAVLHTLTQGKPHAALVQQTLADESLWGRNLNTLPGFADAVTLHLQNIFAEQSNSRNVLEYVKQLF